MSRVERLMWVVVAAYFILGAALVFTLVHFKVLTP